MRENKGCTDVPKLVEAVIYICGGIGMENRIEILRKFIERLLFNTEEDKVLRFNYMSHMNSVSHFCALIALKRGENVELATMAGLLHDFYTFQTLAAENHAEKGALLAREVLNKLKITTDDEIDVICSAIHNHSSKGSIHSAFDEVLIDADVLQHCLFNFTMPIAEWEKVRFANLAKEFALSLH